jgi:hypothetical protein
MKQNFNVGDKLLCINDVDKSYLKLTKGLEYRIIDIKIGALYYKYHIKDDEYKDLYYIEDFDDYFYTKKEERKIKLNKLINEKTES